MIISIPLPATQGFINIGDAGVMITGLLFGPLIGGIAGGIGSSLADIFLGFPNFALATLIIKGIEGFLVGLISNPKKQKLRLNYRDIIAVLVGGSMMATGYFLYELIIYGVPGALFEFFFNLFIQFGLGSIIAILFTVSIRKNIVNSFPQAFDQIFLSKQPISEAMRENKKTNYDPS
jgi:uncharacterized membrane protein